jgi:putative transposase
MEIPTRGRAHPGRHHAPTRSPTAQQARNLLIDPGDHAGRFRFRVRDRDTKFTAALDQVFTGNGTRVIKTPIHSPRANAFAERFAGTLRRECLDRLLIFGGQHLRKVLAQYAAHYNGHRPHQARHRTPPLHKPGQPAGITVKIRRAQAVGGLISEYRRAA